MPRLMRPALPASRRKQGVYAAILMGSSLSCKMVSRYRLVTGTSAVGIRNICWSSVPYMSSSNLGSCPVPSMHSRLTTKGTPTS